MTCFPSACRASARSRKSRLIQLAALAQQVVHRDLAQSRSRRAPSSHAASEDPAGLVEHVEVELGDRAGNLPRRSRTGRR